MMFEISVAPMMGYTDRHYRYLARLISSTTVLYTEMLNIQAVIRHDDGFLFFHQKEKPVVLQLGGNEPLAFAKAAERAEALGYDAINLNIGCPSARVQSGQFGACLMREPDLVAECVQAIKARVTIPVTIKTRIGVDHDDSYAFLEEFVGRTKEAGCKEYIVHARKAWLKGLSPKQNREIPPLDYSRVHRLKKDNPDLKIVINGGIKTVQEVEAQQPCVDGVMIGRAAYDNPWLLYSIEQFLQTGQDTPISLSYKIKVLLAYLSYMRTEVSKGTPLKVMSRHLVHLLDGQSGARSWRRYISGLTNNTSVEEVYKEAEQYFVELV